MLCSNTYYFENWEIGAIFILRGNAMFTRRARKSSQRRRTFLCVGTRNSNLIDYVHKDFGFHEGKISLDIKICLKYQHFLAE